MRLYQNYVVDMTDSVELASAVGMTGDEIQALEAATGVEDLLEDVRQSSSSDSHTWTRSTRDRQRVYCTRDVLTLARERLAAPSQHMQPSTRVRAIDVAAETPEAVEDDVDGSDGTWDEDDVVSDDSTFESFVLPSASASCSAYHGTSSLDQSPEHLLMRLFQIPARLPTYCPSLGRS